MVERSPKDRLYWLMEMLMDNTIEPSNFCDEFYKTYEHELEEPLTSDEKSMFMLISKVGSRFSEFEDDLKNYPSVYTTEQELRKIVREALQKLVK
ncbi:magnesium and cobalt transport protein CorA [Paenibacillus sp. FSL R5-0914]|uniref:magnesium and cobalt transport protein CorA n=1 Tax=Paenibacillus sp. FSL R5-0914 TaxID=2921665 RepID=UPI0030F68D6B